MTAKAYLYARFSADRDNPRTSITRQIEMGEQYCETHGLDLVETIIDAGLSGFSGSHVKRGNLGSFLDSVKKGKIPKGSYLLIEDFDRFSREEFSVALNQVQDILNAGITLVTLRNGEEHTKETFNRNLGQVVLSVVSMFAAHDESKKKSERISKAIKHRHEAWRDDSKKATVKKNGKCPWWLSLDKTGTGYIKHNDRIRSIKKIFTLYQKGLGTQQIQQYMNQNQDKFPAPARFSKRETDKTSWSHSTIDKYLAARALIGEFQPTFKGRQPDGPPIEGFYPQVLPLKLFDEVQELRCIRGERHKVRLDGTRSSSGGKIGHFDNLFRNLAVCGKCGAPLHFDSKGYGHNYLVCSAYKKNNADCVRIGVRYTAFEERLLQELDLLNLQEVFETEGVQSELQTLREQLGSLNAEIQHWNSVALNYHVAIGTAQDEATIRGYVKSEQSAKVESATRWQQKEEIERQIEVLSRASTEAEKTIDNVKSFRGLMLKTTDREKRKEIRQQINSELRKIIAEIVVYPLKENRNYTKMELPRVERVSIRYRAGNKRRGTALFFASWESTEEDMKKDKAQARRIGEKLPHQKEGK